MKKILSFMMIGIMAFSLTACGNSASGNTTQQEAESTLEISEKENDTGLNTVPADEVASADNAQQEEADTDSDSNTEGNSMPVYPPTMKNSLPAMRRRWTIIPAISSQRNFRNEYKKARRF